MLQQNTPPSLSLSHTKVKYSLTPGRLQTSLQPKLINAAGSLESYAPPLKAAISDAVYEMTGSSLCPPVSTRAAPSICITPSSQRWKLSHSAAVHFLSPTVFS